MQGKMEGSRRGLDELRRYIWLSGTALEEASEVVLSREELDNVMKVWDCGTWKACVLAIGCPNETPCADPRPYMMLLNEMKLSTQWVCALEYNADNMPHVHALIRNSQRSDAFVRSAQTLWWSIRFAAMSDIAAPDPILNVIKCQNAHRPSALLAYMVKNPIWLGGDNSRSIEIMQSVWFHDLGARFRSRKPPAAPAAARPSDALDSMTDITRELVEVITEYHCKTEEEIYRAAPDCLAKYLHRPGLSQILRNCLTWVQQTGGAWSLAAIAKKHSPDPRAIHRILLHQAILPTAFDDAFYAWVSKTADKRNTLVLWGPSNTGKSMFIKGFKECCQWGEVVNGGQFSFEGLVGAMFGVWEEPLISPELAEKAKQVFEGMTCSVPVKYKRPQKLDRVPIIMTTNHAPWRFCTKEEAMFRNRMFIFEWLNDATSGFVCRACEHSCQCRVCEESRGSTSAPGGSESGSVPCGEQPDAAVSPGASGCSGLSCSETLGSGSLSDSSSRIRAGAKRRYHSGLTSSSGGSTQQRPHRSGSSSCSGTSIEHGLRSGRQHGSGDSRQRVRRPQSRRRKPVVSRRPRGSARSPLGRDAMEPPRRKRRGRGDDAAGRDRGCCADGSPLVLLGDSDPVSGEIEIHPAESGLGGEVVPLTVPSRSEWLSYLSYLQTRHGD